MPTGREVLRRFQEDEEIYDQLEALILRQTETYQKAVTASIGSALDSLILDENGRIRPLATNRNKLDDLLTSLDQRLMDAGLVDWQDNLKGTVRSRLDTMNSLVADIGVTDAVINDWQNFPAINDHIDKVSQKIAGAVDPIADRVKASIYNFRNDIDKGFGERFTNVRNTLVRKAGILPNYGKTVARTELGAVDTVGRELQADKARITDMKYLGPLDGLTRDFCRQMHSQVRSREAWRAMDNDTGPQPVAVYRGGWNCRHRLMLWRKEWEDTL